MDKKVIVISGPSGVGKTTLYKKILKRYTSEMGFSVSATTRPPREGEENGRDYYFLSKDEFKFLMDNGGLLEYENNYGNYYGTLKTEIDRIWSEGKHCFLDLDVKGALNIKRLFPNEAALIFIAPPSMEALTARLLARDSDTNITERIENAEKEMAHRHQYHYTVINSDLAKASEELDRIVRKILFASS